MLGSLSSGSKQIWLRSFNWCTMEPCRLKDCKVTSIQSSSRPGMDTGPHSNIAMLAESNQAILTIFLPQTLKAYNFAINWHWKSYSFLFERSDSYQFGAGRLES